MAAQYAQRGGACEAFERLGVGAESECARHGYVCRLVPVAGAVGHYARYAVGFGVHTFVAERRKPVGNVDVRYAADGVDAGEGVGGEVGEGVECGVERRVTFHDELRYRLARCAVYGHVVIVDHVEYHVAVCGVVGVAVTMPVGGAHVDFDITYPCIAVNNHGSVKEIRPGIIVDDAGVNDLQPFSVGCSEVILRK